MKDELLFAPLSPDVRRALDGVPALIDKTFPLPGRFRPALPAGVAELSRLLTSGRGERSLSYLGRPNLLSAYLRYFVPWNLYRLCRLLPALPISLAAGDMVIDLGCGPLTLAAALWISRPALRKLALEFRCIDRSGPAMEAGKQFFAALAGKDCPWKIRTVKEDIDGRARGGANGGKAAPSAAAAEKNAALICAVNVLNELYGNIPHSDTDALTHSAENAARLLCGFAGAGASILAVEPGVPQSGQFISLLRGALIERGRPPLSPCTHRGDCPAPGGIARGNRNAAVSNAAQGASGSPNRPGRTNTPGKNRWCHFAFETGDAPEVLRKLSAAAGIPKERAVVSFLLAGPSRPANQKPPCISPNEAETPLRIISDAFPLPERRFGRYACSERGLVLITGEKSAVEKAASGMSHNAIFAKPEQRDPKSGALICGV
jgi:hypothetical protein